MIRITLLELALLATPFLLYFLYRAVVGRRRSAAGADVDETPYQILFLTGSAVALAALVAAVLLGREETDTTTRSDLIYVPPRVVDGRSEPGHFIPREEAIASGLIEDEGESPDAPAPADPEAPQGSPQDPRAP